MKKIITIFISAYSLLSASAQNADEILSRVEKNMSSDNRIFESSMIIHGIRNDRTITSKTYSVGDKRSFTEYLSPAREQGTKMLKLENQLWIYSPSTDRTIQISGPVSYTHLRAHETPEHLVCRLLLEKKKNSTM